MLNNKIELIAVNRIKDAILQSNILEPFIDDNDKTPSWDGNIFVYKSSDTKKSNLKGKIPVQVKGTTVKKFSDETISFPFNISDLKNFLTDGGVLFFVVQIISVYDIKIYYTSLLPIDIDEFLKKVKINQKKLSATLKVLNISSSRQLESICHSFLHNKELQYSTHKYMKNIESFNNISFSVFPDGTSFNDYMLNNEIYLYGHENSNTLPMPISKMEVETISHKMENEIVIDSIKYFDSYEVTNSKKNTIISFGKNFTFSIDNRELKYKTLGNLKERLNDAKFLNNVVEKSYFTLGGTKISFPKLPKSQSYSNYLKYLNEIAKLMEFFHINNELKMDDFNNEDYSNINFLIGNILYNTKNISETIKPGIKNVKIANINILTFITLDENRIISIEDYFSSIYKKYTIVYNTLEDTKKNIACSIYIQLKATDIIKSDNLDLEIVEESVKSISLNNDYAGVVNFLILELITAYDMNNNFTNSLNTALKLCEWLEKYDSNSYIYTINKYQIIKRLRKLNKEEKLKLMEIRSASVENIQIQCAISILLENKSDFEYYFENLPKEEYKVFCEYPIYKLIG